MCELGDEILYSVKKNKMFMCTCWGAQASLQESGVDWKRFFDAGELADLEEAELAAKRTP